jgi:hypothetical protein
MTWRTVLILAGFALVFGWLIATAPVCTPDSPRGIWIGNAIHVAGC